MSKASKAAAAAASAAAPPSALRAIIETRAVGQERLPMLEVIAERSVRALGTSVRGLTADPIEVVLDDLRAVRFGDGIARLPSPTMIGVVRFEPWQGYGLMTVETPLIHALVEALMGANSERGARPAPDALESSARVFTPIEIALVGKMMRLTLDEFCKSFAVVEPLVGTLERIELNPRFAAIANPSNVAVALDFGFSMNGSGGNGSGGALTLMIPTATLEPARGRLAQRFMGEQQGPTNIWRAHLEAEMMKTEADIAVVLGERAMSLAAVMAIRTGDVIPFGAAPDGRMEMRCRGVRIGTAQIGQRRGHLAIAPQLDLAEERR